MARIKATGKVNHGGTTSAGSFASLPSAGNAIIVVVGGANLSLDFTTGDVVDNQSNTYTLAIESAAPDGGNRSRVAIFYALNIGAPSGTFTVTYNSNVSIDAAWSASEHSNIALTSALDVTATARGTTGTVNTGTTGTTAQANELIAAVCCNRETQASITVVVDDPAWVQEHEELSFSTSEPGEGDTRYVTATGTQTCSWTMSAGVGNGWSGVIATFLEAGGAAAAPVRLRRMALLGMN